MMLYQILKGGIRQVWDFPGGWRVRKVATKSPGDWGPREQYF